jgi:hypothetical protein
VPLRLTEAWSTTAVYYWTIRGEGSSNGCRETAIGRKIARAVGKDRRRP